MKRKIVHIDSEKCNGCGACVHACHENAIVLENGKNVFPEEIEEALGSIEEISESVVVGRKSPDGEQINLTAVVFPDYSRFPEGVSDQEVNDVIRSRVSELNKELASFKRIKAVEIRKTEFEKTTTKKIKRQLIR